MFMGGVDVIEMLVLKWYFAKFMCIYLLTLT